MTKEERINEELTRISQRFEKADANQRAIAGPLIQNAAFMKVTLEDLQEIINAEGVIDEYKNGENQYGTKQSATLQSYNALIKNYASVIKTLASILPREERPAFKPEPFRLREKTPEEIEEENRREKEHQRQIQEEIARAVEYQRQQREAENGRKAVQKPGVGKYWTATK